MVSNNDKHMKEAHKHCALTSQVGLHYRKHQYVCAWMDSEPNQFKSDVSCKKKKCGFAIAEEVKAFDTIPDTDPTRGYKVVHKETQKEKMPRKGTIEDVSMHKSQKLSVIYL